MDIITFTLVMYLGTSLTLGAASSFHRPISITLVSTSMVLGAYGFALFSAPAFIFLFFFAVPFCTGRFSCQLIRRMTQALAGLDPRKETAC